MRQQRRFRPMSATDLPSAGYFLLTAFQWDNPSRGARASAQRPFQAGRPDCGYHRERKV